jgi:hypothetical protein
MIDSLTPVYAVSVPCRILRQQRRALRRRGFLTGVVWRTAASGRRCWGYQSIIAAAGAVVSYSPMRSIAGARRASITTALTPSTRCCRRTRMIRFSLTICSTFAGPMRPIAFCATKRSRPGRRPGARRAESAREKARSSRTHNRSAQSFVINRTRPGAMLTGTSTRWRYGRTGRRPRVEGAAGRRYRARDRRGSATNRSRLAAMTRRRWLRASARQNLTRPSRSASRFRSSADA